jgi:NAD+ synthase (glutamine-hydrolysing)
MQVILHQTHQTVCDFNEIMKYLHDFSWDNGQCDENLHLFPELFLCGYPLLDICLQRSFITSYQKHLENIDTWAKSWSPKKKHTLLLGGLYYELTDEGSLKSIKNVIYQLEPGKKLKKLYAKRLLPNYDIFDEKKYYTAGTECKIFEWNNMNFGLLICEDMWASNVHKLDPCREMYQYCQDQKIELDGVINLSASPFIVQKDQTRFQRGKEISKLFDAPFFYVNRVGGEDEILFDGQSFVCDAKKNHQIGKRFSEQVLICQFDQTTFDVSGNHVLLDDNIWENLFKARLKDDKPELIPWDDHACQEVFEALTFGVQEYARKSGFNKFTIALSGGMDSALVLTLLKLSLEEGQSLEALYMPSIYSSPLSYDLSLKLCENLKVPLTTIPIKFLHSTAKNAFSQSYNDAFEGLTDENIQSRLRGTLLYTRSNQIGSMVVNTSNKSEIAVGYSTQYGDSVGAISMLGDLYKTQVYRLAQWVNDKYENIIPQDIIDRAPTAELRENQEDSQSLPAYPILDAILEGILSYRYNTQELIAKGLPKEDVEKVFSLYRKSEFKRYQFCPIIKVGTKSFGFGYRIPISKTSTFYHS